MRSLPIVYITKEAYMMIMNKRTTLAYDKSTWRCLYECKKTDTCTGGGQCRIQSLESLFSPSSLYYALAILGEGASGETEEEILSALHSGDKNKLSDQCARLSGRYAYNKEYDRL